MSNITLDLGPALRAHQQQDVDTCLAEISPILQYAPHHPVALHLKAWAISKRGESEQALEILSGVIEKNPRLVPARAEYGAILMANSRHAEALQQLREAHDLQPNRDAVVVKYCICLIKNHRSDEAEPLLRALLKRSPNDLSARFTLATALFHLGKWQDAFREYQCRLKMDSVRRDLILDTEKFWKGQSLEGKTLLIQCEQGYGDQILFIRYAALVKQKFQAEQIVVLAKPEMKRLLESATGVDVVVTDKEFTDYDFQVPLLHLPFYHGTMPETIPLGGEPYIFPSQEWSGIAENSIGICWRTNLIANAGSEPIDHEKRVKSLNCSEAERLCREVRAIFPETQIVSLQPGATDEEKAMLKRCGIADLWEHPIRDFADTAALISQMDLVVSIDTGVAHLAGALGKPVWNLLPNYADWRWSQDAEYSRWYPDMRLIRQGEQNEWETLDCG